VGIVQEGIVGEDKHLVEEDIGVGIVEVGIVGVGTVGVVLEELHRFGFG